MRDEVEEVEGELGEAERFLTNKGAENFKKTLTKKKIIGEGGFKELVPPLKEEVGR